MVSAFPFLSAPKPRRGGWQLCICHGLRGFCDRCVVRRGICHGLDGFCDRWVIRRGICHGLDGICDRWVVRRDICHVLGEFCDRWVVRRDICHGLRGLCDRCVVRRDICHGLGGICDRCMVRRDICHGLGGFCDRWVVREALRAVWAPISGAGGYIFSFCAEKIPHSRAERCHGAARADWAADFRAESCLRARVLWPVCLHKKRRPFWIALKLLIIYD